MKRKRHNPEQIIRKLRTAEQLLNQGQAVADVCRAARCQLRRRALCINYLLPILIDAW